jgi:hypothetical protein
MRILIALKIPNKYLHIVLSSVVAGHKARGRSDFIMFWVLSRFMIEKRIDTSLYNCTRLLLPLTEMFGLLYNRKILLISLYT